jgi:hypothetical protein
MDRPEHLAKLCARLEDRFEYVITMGRHEEESMDDTGTGAFAFIIGGDSDNALVLECAIAGDGAAGQFTIYGLTDGERVPLSMVEMNGEVMISHPLTR